MPLTKIQSLGITDGTIVNADINASAAIAGTKLSGAGKVLQVVTATDSTTRSTTSTSYVTASNALSVSITPSSASNKVFVIVSTSARVTDQTFLTIYSGATNIGNSEGMVELYFNTSSGDHRCGVTMIILDSPSTTSATTYQLYLKVASGSTGYINHNSTKCSITAFEIAG